MTESQLDPESQARLAAAVAAAEADAMLREAADYERWRARAEQAEAAIERVRAVAAELPPGYARRVLTALDGPPEPGTNRRDKDQEIRTANEQIERLTAELATAEAAIDRVRDLHIEVDGTPWAEGGCVECGHDYPCATLRALDGTQPPAEPAEPVAPGPATDLGPLREALYGAHDTDQAGDAR